MARPENIPNALLLVIGSVTRLFPAEPTPRAKDSTEERMVDSILFLFVAVVVDCCVLVSVLVISLSLFI